MPIRWNARKTSTLVSFIAQQKWSIFTITLGYTSPKDRLKIERIGLRNSTLSIFAKSLVHRLPFFQASQQLFMWEMLQIPERYWNSVQWVCRLQDSRILFNLFLIGKSALIGMIFILINKVLFELRYVNLNLIVKNCKNFLSNLIYVCI